jgi:hypothetical protein
MSAPHEQHSPEEVDSLSARARWAELLFWLIPVVAFVAVYARATNYGFVWDDELWYLKTGALRHSLRDGLTKTIFDLVEVTQDRPTHESYRPLAYLSAWLDAQLFGVHPRGMHFHSLALALAYLPLWAWLGRLRGWSVLLTTTLCTWFVVHPLQAEVFVYLSGRPDLIACLLATTSLAFALQSIEVARNGRRDWPFLAAAGLCFMLSLLAKEGTLGLPLALVALTLADGRRGEVIRPTVALAIGLAVYFVVRFSIVGRPGSHAPLGTGFLALPDLALQLIKSFVLPLDLAISRLPVGGYPGVGWVLCVTAVAILIARYRRRECPPLAIRVMAWLAAGWIGWVVLIGPSAVVAISSRTLSDRYAHASTLLLIFALGEPIRLVVGRLWRYRLAPPLVVGTVAVFELSLAVVGWVQVGFWSNVDTVYRRAVLVAPLDPQASYRLGSYLASSGHLEEALPHLARATELAPGNFTYWNDLGAAQMQLQMWPEAVASFARSFEMSGGRRPMPLVNVAQIHLQLGDRSRACAALQRAAALRPEIPRGTQLRRRWCSTKAR